MSPEQKQELHELSPETYSGRDYFDAEELKQEQELEQELEREQNAKL